MTATETQITCDHDTCKATALRINQTLRKARAHHRQLGWRYIAGHPASGPARDLCPVHAYDRTPARDG